MTVPLRLLQAPSSAKGLALGRLVEAWPRGVTLFLMTDDPEAAAFRAWHQGLAPACDVEIVATGNEVPILESEMWTQDPWLAAEQDGATFLRHLTRTDRPGRQALWFSAFRQTPYDQPFIHLAGGNTLTGPDFRLVGAQSIDLTTRIGSCPISMDEALECHARLDPRPMHVFGFPLLAKANAPVELRQQPHHLDLVVSLTGKYAPDGRPIILVADPRRSPDPTGPRMEGWAEQLDASAARLEAKGFAVIRNKVPYVAHAIYAPNPMLRVYNNVILENDLRPGSGKTRPLVWVPHFGDLEVELVPFDGENRQIWEGLGFEIVPVYGWSALVRSGGAIRCASKILKRGI